MRAVKKEEKKDYIAFYDERTNTIYSKQLFTYSDVFNYSHIALATNQIAAETELKNKLSAIADEYIKMAKKLKTVKIVKSK